MKRVIDKHIQYRPKGNPRYRTVIPEELRPYFINTTTSKPQTTLLSTFSSCDPKVINAEKHHFAIEHDRLVADARAKLNASLAPSNHPWRELQSFDPVTGKTGTMFTLASRQLPDRRQHGL